MKRIEIEKLLQWTYCDELTKGGDTSSASNFGIMLSYAELGTRIDDQLGPFMKLPPIFGEPHADALEINRLVYRMANPARALIIMHARMKTRPDWHPEPIRIFPVRNGSKVHIVGECKGRNRYTTGSYCPLRYEPTLSDVEHARNEYRAWHAGLLSLVKDLQLTEHIATPPDAAPEPWIADKPKRRVLVHLTSGGKSLTSYEPSRLTQALPAGGAFCV